MLGIMVEKKNYKLKLINRNLLAHFSPKIDYVSLILIMGMTEVCALGSSRDCIAAGDVRRRPQCLLVYTLPFKLDLDPTGIT